MKKLNGITNNCIGNGTTAIYIKIMISTIVSHTIINVFFLYRATFSNELNI